MITKIERENFEAWLYSLPLDQGFNYLSCPFCVVSEFVRTQVSARMIYSGCESTTVYTAVHGWLGDTEVKHVIVWPDWLRTLLHTCLDTQDHPIIRASKLQTEYRRMFPERVEIASILDLPVLTLPTNPQPQEQNAQT